MTERAFVLTFTSSMALILLGAALKITHLPNGEYLLGAGMFLSIVWTVIALFETHRSSRITTSEKIMWTTGLILLNTVAGLLYYFSGRERVMKRSLRG